MDELVKKGSLRLHWVETHMPVLMDIRRRFIDEQPLAGLKIGMALHTEAKTGMLAVTLADAGAKIRLASCNPLSTDDSVAAALREEYGLDVYAKKWESSQEYYNNLNTVLNMAPDFLIDDGADLIAMAHTSRKDILPNIKAANEETTTGVVRLRAMAKDKALKFPVLDVNDAKMKFLFDNRYGTGQSAFDGWMNATNLIVAGKRLVVAGYGWCGKGVAMRAKGLGASVIVTEVDPVKAIEAKMDGYEVMRMIDAVKVADIIITVTGCKDIITADHLAVMKDGCIMGNVGHFDNEINKNALDEMSDSKVRVRDFIDEYRMKDGRSLYLIAEGRLMNLAAGQGHPAEIMDMSFATQALGIVHMTRNYDRMDNEVYAVPAEIDMQIATLKLKSMGVTMGGRHLSDPFLSVYGHVTVDQILSIDRFLDPGITADALSKKTTLGGTGPNIAVSAARLGCPTALCAFVGPDFPAKYMEFMESSGLIMDEVVTLDGEETSTCVIINDRDLVTRVFFYQGPQGHAERTGVRLDRMARASANVHFCTGQPSYYISLMEDLRGGRRIALDPAQEVHRVWNADLVGQALPLSDALFCNDLEAATICRYLQLDDVMEVDLVVRTEGDKGSTAKVGDEVMHIPAVKADRVVDVTGAGDNYRAGFYAATYRGVDVPEALVIASAVSSFAVEEVGALNNIPTWDAVLERAEPYLGMIS